MPSSPGALTCELVYDINWFVIGGALGPRGRWKGRLTMADLPTPEDAAHEPDLREIPKWADRYARHRVLLVLLFLVAYVAAFALISGLSALAGLAWRAGNRPLALVLTVADLTFCVWWACLCLSRRRQIALTAAANRWLYRNEGEAAPAAEGLAPEEGPGMMQPTRLDKAVLWGFGIALCASIIFGFFTDPDFARRYMQPINAAIAVPFMVYLAYRMRRFSTPVMFLWPALYAAHAILVLAAVPWFVNLDPGLSTLSFLVYGLFAVLVAHAYSRYALRKLRGLAGPPEDVPTGGR